jgi:hypothetical protein
VSHDRFDHDTRDGRLSMLVSLGSSSSRFVTTH